MKILYIVAAVMLSVLLYEHWSLCVDYEREQAAHARTRAELTTALVELQRWRTVAGETLMAADAQKQLAEACLAREAQSQSDANARKSILTQAKPRPRTETENRQVVDDETRARAVSRLNRGL